MVALLGCGLCHMVDQPIEAGLAITEAMSSAATTQGGATVSANSDWWELTNFSTNTLDLTGYRWNDNQGGLIGADPTPFDKLRIGPGESIIFFQSNSPASMSPEQFRAWWGPALPAQTQVVIYEGNGLSSTGDGIRIWPPDAVSDVEVVDSVDFGAAIRGSTFVYDPASGIFGLVSTNGGADGPVKAATADDLGSPGRNSGPVALTIKAGPTNTAANPGDVAVFTVMAGGLPRPAYQWYFEGQPLPGERFNVLRVTNASPANIGSYRVVLATDFESLTSAVVRLTLNALPEAPQFTLLPRDQNAFVGQKVVLHTQASGVPQPSYQWFFAGKLLDGEQGESLILEGVELTDAGMYSVLAHNDSGTVSNGARLVVTPRPKLAITEVMAAPDTNGPVRGHNDWWELTNLGDFPVDLSGYRFDDGSAILAAAITLTNRLSIAPGESIVFVENMSSEEFRRWWGDANFQPGQQIVTYRGGGLSLSSLGDAINLWNGVASEDFDTAVSEVFSTATNGVSFGWDITLGSFGAPSVPGIGGAWRALENGDIGSPGFLTNPPYPRILEFLRKSGGLSITWTSIPGRTYAVESRPGLGNDPWTPVATLTASGNFLTYETPAVVAAPAFFRVSLEP